MSRPAAAAIDPVDRARAEQPSGQAVRPLRLTVVLTHPIQYYAPWFRHIAHAAPAIDLTVLYATVPMPEQQGVGFGQPFVWDTPLLEGYAHRIVRPARPGDHVGTGQFWGLDVPAITEAIAEARPDVLLLPGWHSATLVRAWRAARRRGIPVLYRGDTHLQSAPAGWRRTPWVLRTRRMLRHFDGYLAVGSRANAFLRFCGAPADRIFRAPHCVDNAFFAAQAGAWQAPERRAALRREYGLADDAFVVLFAGKLEAKKRPLDVIRAAARLSGSVAVLVAGAGALEDASQREAAALGVRVAWAGLVNQSGIARAYAAADCLALPSDWGETWGLVVNEALATGLPCVVSDRVGCAPDLIEPDVTGATFPFGDLDAFAAGLERIRALRAEGRDFAVACRERVAHWSIEASTAGLVRACEAVCGARTSVVNRRKPGRRVLACCGSMVVVFGLERMTFEVLSVLRERGTAGHCIVNSWENHRIVAEAERIGASWSIGSYRVSPRRTWNPVFWLRAAWDMLLTGGGLIRDVALFRPDTIFVPDPVSILRNWPALALLRLTGTPIVLKLGNVPAPGRFYRRLWRFVINPVVDRVVCNSRFTQQALLAHGVSASKVSWIYNTIPARRTGTRSAVPARDESKVIYVGQVIPDKGLDLLLEAIGLLVARGHDVRLDVVGPVTGWALPEVAAFRDRVKRRAEEPDLAGRVRFLGLREDVPALLAGAGVHCCPSRPECPEGFGLVVVEAKVAGLPSVVLPSGALPELVTHQEDGWVCAEGTADALAEGLAFFLDQPDHLARASAAARASAGAFDRARFGDAWNAVFRESR